MISLMQGLRQAKVVPSGVREGGASPPLPIAGNAGEDEALVRIKNGEEDGEEQHCDEERGCGEDRPGGRDAGLEGG